MSHLRERIEAAALLAFVLAGKAMVLARFSVVFPRDDFVNDLARFAVADLGGCAHGRLDALQGAAVPNSALQAIGDGHRRKRDVLTKQRVVHQANPVLALEKPMILDLLVSGAGPTEYLEWRKLDRFWTEFPLVDDDRE